ncbi:MAG: K(+)-transporting ATPase subunit C [Alphaproteobacteria bacterium]|nr:K(+)-transporting ATPase subunit C [Alphaproteobacteria bacterium]
MFRELRACLGLFLILFFLTGLAYPMLVLGIGQGLFPRQANGSLVEEGGKIIGSSLIGQNFTGESYFHPRPSAAGQGYDAANSSGSNLAPSSPELARLVAARVADIRKESSVALVPVDLVTASGSGLDPHISPAAAKFQVPRIAVARQMDTAQLEELIVKNTEPRSLFILGESRVNVLGLNLALDRFAAAKP